jgi:peroxiredoxin
VVDVRKDYESFRQAGGDVAAVTMGTPDQVTEFRKRLDLPFDCFADSGRIAYQAFGLAKGSIGKIAGVAVWKQSFKALLRHGGGIPIGDPMQMPGTFVIDSTGVIQFAHYPRNSADHPSHEVMIKAIRHRVNSKSV